MTTHAGDPECHQELAPAELLPAAGAEGDQHHQEPASTMPPPIPVVVSCVQTGSADLLLDGGSSSEDILLACSSTSSSASTQLEVGGAFPVLPTVSVESEEPQNLSLTWYAPTCASDFTLEWVQFVMKEFLRENNQDIDSLKQAENIQQFQVNMAGSPEDGASKKGGNQSVLSTAYKIMVDVPDPPSADEAQNDEFFINNDDDDEEEDQEDQSEFSSPNHSGIERSKSPVPAKIHHLFVKVPPKQTAKFERMVRRNRTLEHEVKVYHELLRDLQKFINERLPRNPIVLNIPKLYHGFSDTSSTEEKLPNLLAGPMQFSQRDQSVLVIEDLTERGFASKDWFKYKLNHQEVLLALTELAKFHACGLAYRMSLKEEIDEKYPYLDDDLYTSNMTKELLAKYLDSYLHFLTYLDPSIQEHVLRLRKISNEVFQLLFKLRRPTDTLGTRFNTVCHGDMWMGNLMFRTNPDTGESEECYMIDLHSAQYLSPATDLAHLLLTSTTRDYRKQHWDEVVKHYYDVFNRTLAEFGLVLRHLGTSYNDFLYEVKRALRGQFLCVAVIIPIVVYCGPTEWRFERRRGSSSDRKNTVRHLIQMMSISESNECSEEDKESSDENEEKMDIPAEFVDLFNDKELKQVLIDLIHTADDLDLLDFKEFCRHIDTPKPMWSKTQATTGKHIPVY